MTTQEWTGTCADCGITVRDGEVGSDNAQGQPYCSRCSDLRDTTYLQVRVSLTLNVEAPNWRTARTAAQDVVMVAMDKNRDDMNRPDIGAYVSFPVAGCKWETMVLDPEYHCEKCKHADADDCALPRCVCCEAVQR